MLATPIVSGRNNEPAASEEAELLAITNHVRRGGTLYFIRTSIGTTLDVLFERNAAIKRRDAIRDRVHNNGPRVDAYERIGMALIRL